jgi:hypothetical protein
LIGIRVGVLKNKNIFDKLMDQRDLSIEKLGSLSGWLVDGIALVALHKVQNLEKIMELCDKMAERMVCLVCEAERRKMEYI